MAFFAADNAKLLVVHKKTRFVLIVADRSAAYRTKEIYDTGVHSVR